MKYLVIPDSGFDDNWFFDCEPENLEGVLQEYVDDGSLDKNDVVYELHLVGKIKKQLILEK